MSDTTVDIVQAAHRQHTTHGIPHGLTSITPFIAVTDARGAIAFYRDVFGARLVDATEMGGAVAHAVLDFGHGQLQLGEPSPDYHLVPPPEGEDDCYSLGLYCSDVDDVVERAKAAGATVAEPVVTFVSGDRFASIRDPFGTRWSIMTRVEDLSEEDSARRVAEWRSSKKPRPRRDATRSR
jgi:PhnB protein